MAERAREKVSIFAPSPLFTVTVEVAPGKDPEVHFHPGGQGVWVARMTTLLGVETSLCSVMGGESGQIVTMLLEADGIAVRRVDGLVANGGYIHDRRSGEREVVAEIPSPSLSRHELDDLYNLAIADGIAAGVAVLTGNSSDGVVPSDVYGRLASDLGANGVKVVVDISGTDLKALTSGVCVLKASHEDLLRDGHVKSVELEDILAFMEENRDLAEHIVISRAGEPAWVMLDGEAKAVHPPQFEALDHRGAGDSMTAAIAAGLARGLPIDRCVRLGAAAGALNVTRHGLGSGRRESVETLARTVRLRALTKAGAKTAKASAADQEPEEPDEPDTPATSDKPAKPAAKSKPAKPAPATRTKAAAKTTSSAARTTTKRTRST